jgi:propionyl-CoA carboxylase beta chain
VTLPLSPNQPYDMKKVITSVVDGGDYMEVHATYAQQITCGFARIDGHTIGLVSNQPQILAGVLDIARVRRPRASCARATRSIFRS